jgi:hypothetical protein
MRGGSVNVDVAEGESWGHGEARMEEKAWKEEVGVVTLYSFCFAPCSLLICLS